MTIATLIKLLQKEDPKRIVVLSSDSEGNSFTPANSLSTYAYRNGEIGIEKLTPALIKQGYGEDDVLTGGKPAVVL